GNLDIVRTVPATKVPEARQKYGSRLIEQASPSFTYIGLPIYDDLYKNKRLRQALSLAIDRQPIIDKVFQGRYAAAQSFSPPTFPGGRDNTCRYCAYDPARAKKLLAEAGGWPTDKKIELWYNSGCGHDAWMRAVGEQ